MPTTVTKSIILSLYTTTENMNRIYWRLLLISSMLLISTVNAQSYKDSLDIVLEQQFGESDIPGFHVVILNRNGVAYQKGFGYADIENEKPFTSRTVTNIGSVSKTFIAVALMKAIELKYFTLDTDINEILPFKVENPYFAKDTIRVRHLTSHTSGIIDNDSIYHKSYRFESVGNNDNTAMGILGEMGYNGGLGDSTLGSFLENYLSKRGELFKKANFCNNKAGESYGYSNIASSLAAYLIEVKSEMKFSDFTEKFIFKPLLMDSSDWFGNKTLQKSYAIHYLDKQTTIPFYSLITYPDGGLLTSSMDLSKYVAEMISALNGQSKLLDKESFEEMLRPEFSETELPDNFSLSERNKGILWNLYNDGYIGHDGDDPGVSTNLLFNKTQGIVFMANIYLDSNGVRNEILNTLKRYASKF